MRTSRGIMAAFLGLALLLSPSLADARAGGGKSSGSRGSQTYQATPAKPIERSMTQPTSPGVPPGSGGLATQRPGMATPAPAMGGMFGSPFMTGLLGGFLGAGLAGMIFGSSAHAAGMEGSAGAGLLGMILQFALIGGIAYLGYTLFRRMSGSGPARPATVGAASGPFAREAADGRFGGFGGGAAPAIEAGPDVTDADRAAFGSILAEIQTSWSRGELAALKRLATPEMVSYFAEDLTDASSRGERNVVERIELKKGDVVDNWVEGDRQYATAVMTWSAIDYIERDGQVVTGSRDIPVEATEAWTFVRNRDGRWLLSAIQQV
ncbi:MAG: TIM44-like domain-containing protein [Alphaproteobacteria bacterium]|nr:TIM44-like domain-containing protein [Alphaproteobacteria bacterium]